ncbi:MAG TPA: NAD(P)/FAD-dependent oxidoreductase [Blastocatellia bacterium]|nr:NAD(P)/FAD-dependent oxidoreductase [Blastocatellia bacterium]
MSDTAQVIIIGGGVVGLAIAAELSHDIENLFVLEAQPRLGQGASTRNSGVIHAGMYYKPGSLKAVHCVRGRRMLYEFCERYAVPHKRIGKFIVADSEDEFDALDTIKRRGEENGVEGLEIVGREFIERHEPNVASPLALYSPQTGIIEAEALLKTLARLAQENGAHILTDTKVLNIEPLNKQAARVVTSHEEVEAQIIINAAGLYADEIARMTGHGDYIIHPVRGEYAELPPRLSGIINGLIYPLPPAHGHGLGVHFTKNLAGTVLLGPNSIHVTEKDNYENGRASLESFHQSASRIVPSLKPEDFRLSHTGIRARLRPINDWSFADWVIERDRQWPNIIHAIGIESPGLTACLSLGKMISEMVRETLS